MDKLFGDGNSLGTIMNTFTMIWKSDLISEEEELYSLTEKILFPEQMIYGGMEIGTSKAKS